MNRQTHLIICCILTLLTGQSAFAALSGPSTDADGNYSISWTMSCNTSNTVYYLYENGNQISVNSCSLGTWSKSITGKPPGTYNYTLDYCDEYLPEPGLLCASDMGLEEYHTVVVSSSGGGSGSGAPVARTGYYDTDSLLDFFVDSGVSNPIVLRQLPGQTFQIVTLSSSQIQTFSNNWPASQYVGVHISDFNVDGTEDYALIGVGQLIPGVDTPIVYSSSAGGSGTNPSQVIAIDANKQEFLGDTLGLMLDYNYLYRRMLEEGAVTFYSYGFSWGYYAGAYLSLWDQGDASGPYIDDNDDPFDDAVAPARCAILDCYYDGTQWQLYVYAEVIIPTWNFSMFHPSTITLAQTMDSFDAGTSDIDDILGVIEQVLGAISCQGLDQSDIDFFDSVHTTSFFRTNTCIAASVFRVLNAINTAPFVENGHEPEDPRVQFRARLLGGVVWTSNAFSPVAIMHASVHHPDDTLLETWYSGFPQNGGLNPLQNQAGNLVKKIRDPSDSKENTLLVGYINSPLSPTAAWTDVAEGSFNYENNLQYCLLPESWELLPPGDELRCLGYNSNSFAKGLADIVGSIQVVGHRVSGQGGVSIEYFSLDAQRFPGITKPVPPSEF